MSDLYTGKQTLLKLNHSPHQLIMYHQLMLPSPRDFESAGYVRMDLYLSYEESKLEEIYRNARRIIQEAGNIPLHLELFNPGMVYPPENEHDDDSDYCSGYASDGEDALTEHRYESRPGLIEFFESTRGWEAAEIHLCEYPGFAQDVLRCEPGEPPLETWMRLRSLSLISDWRNVPPEGEENHDCGPLRMTGESFPLLRAVTLHLKCCNV